MGDSGGATNAASKAVKTVPQQGVFKRLLELLMMLVSAVLVMFAWDSAQRAQEESAGLRAELRRARAEAAERSGTRALANDYQSGAARPAAHDHRRELRRRHLSAPEQPEEVQG